MIKSNSTTLYLNCERIGTLSTYWERPFGWPAPWSDAEFKMALALLQTLNQHREVVRQGAHPFWLGTTGREEDLQRGRRRREVGQQLN
jgi:hypothetical protein